MGAWEHRQKLWSECGCVFSSDDVLETCPDKVMGISRAARHQPTLINADKETERLQLLLWNGLIATVGCYKPNGVHGFLWHEDQDNAAQAL